MLSDELQVIQLVRAGNYVFEVSMYLETFRHDGD